MPPKSLLAMALEVDVGDNGMGMDIDGQESFKVSDAGTLQLLSQSQSNYHINANGMSKASSPASSGAGTPGTGELYYNCKASDIEKVSKLGAGASGVVFKAVHLPSKTLCALKSINALDKANRDQLLNEIRTLCNSPNAEGLVRFYGAFYDADSGHINLALEYMNGGSLEDFCKAIPEQRLPEDVLAQVAGKILVGLRFLHHDRHMVHRDIKPGNLLMDLNGNPKITDFGISTSLENTVAQCGTHVGTMNYMSPERLNNEPYSFPGDIWSIGLTFFELAVGQFPYDVNNGPLPFIIAVTTEAAPTVPAGFSPAFADFIDKCLQKDPALRPTAEQLLNHPWIAGAAAVDLASFVRGLVPDAEQRLAQDAAILAAKQ
mmetsp:Transcript_41946/g.50829  ORF Transcript_41946/g.50829 Transcript_41946/m.50829 type:complete len:375 (+) Transcript_41946:396-1520(+)|eukprot:CAMPEP_0197844860 /NCGR_PEP_ID=MMETSP1438-20131217/1833_1 /TAXON_ID=1461541 /ORGANISM="Pterosperma sp., Strain CCMP1384" /LENGTH=374 /DNA_ID=CAMNT_0043455869 /DNA_START=375 /DNA_END=1499 /DNA_ORIENTATION=+